MTGDYGAGDAVPGGEARRGAGRAWVLPVLAVVVAAAGLLLGAARVPAGRASRPPRAGRADHRGRALSAHQAGHARPATALTRRAEKLTLRIRNISCGQGKKIGSGFAFDSHTLITNRHAIAGAAALPKADTGTARPFRPRCLPGTTTGPPRRHRRHPRRPSTGRSSPDPGVRSRPPSARRSPPLAIPSVVPSRSPTAWRARPTSTATHSTPRIAFDGQVMKVSAPVKHGNSGGPLLDSRGRLVGVVFAGQSGCDRAGLRHRSAYAHPARAPLASAAQQRRDPGRHCPASSDPPGRPRPGLRVVFCGSGAGAASAARGAYYAGPGNKFWPTPACRSAAPAPRRLAPEEFASVLEYGIGLTDLAKTRERPGHAGPRRVRRRTPASRHLGGRPRGDRVQRRRPRPNRAWPLRRVRSGGLVRGRRSPDPAPRLRAPRVGAGRSRRGQNLAARIGPGELRR